MAATSTFKTAKDGASVAFDWAMVDESVSGKIAAKVYLSNLAEALVNPATSDLQTTANTKLDTLIANIGTPAQQSGATVTANLGTIGAAATAANQATEITGLAAIITALGTPAQQSGATVTANAGANLNTSALSTSANQILSHTPITPATATATKGMLLGAQYNSTLATWTNGQQGVVQCDQNGAINTGFDGLTVSPASLTSAAVLFTQEMTGYESITVQVTSSGTTCTITYEVSENNVNYNPVCGTNAIHGGSVDAASTSTTTGAWKFAKFGKYFQARVSTYTSGTVTVVYTLHKSPHVHPPGLVSAQGRHVVGATPSTPPFPIAVVSRTTYSAVAANQLQYIPSNLVGVPIVLPWAIPELTWQYAAAAGGLINTTTAITIQAAGAAGVRNYCKSLQLSAITGTYTATEIAIRDGAAGTVIWRATLPGSTTAVPFQLMKIDFEPPLRGTAATLMEFVTLTAQGASTALHVSAQGFQGP